MFNWKAIKEEWQTTTVTLAALAEKHNIKLGTLKSRKSREKWSKDATEKDASPITKVATVKEDATTQSNIERIEEPVLEVNDELTDRQRLFCLYYIKSYNQTMAAIKAGYAPSSAHVRGSELVRNRKVVAEIQRLKGEQRKGLFVDAMDVLEKYIQIAFADITDYTAFGRKEIVITKDDTGEDITTEVNYVDFKQSTEIDGTIITEVKQGKEGVSIKLADKMRALDFLAKHFDLLNENERKQLENEKLRISNQKASGEDDTEYEDDGFLEALKGKAVKWDE